MLNRTRELTFQRRSPPRRVRLVMTRDDDHIAAERERPRAKGLRRFARMGIGVNPDGAVVLSKRGSNNFRAESASGQPLVRTPGTSGATPGWRADRGAQPRLFTRIEHPRHGIGCPIGFALEVVPGTLTASLGCRPRLATAMWLNS